MISKEWHDAWWKLAIATFLVLVAVAVIPIPTPYKEITKMAKRPAFSVDSVTIGNDIGDIDQKENLRAAKKLEIPKQAREPRNPAELAADEMWAAHYAGGFFVLFPLAGLLGVAMVSGEASSGTIFLLLSKPVERGRLLLAKYGVGAATLLTAVVLWDVLLVVAAAARGYPLGRIGVDGLILPAALLWLGSLFFLGLALLASVVFRSVIGSIVATALGSGLVFILPEFLLSRFYSVQANYLGIRPGFHSPGVIENVIRSLNLTYYWTGEGLATMNLSVCLIAAALPLLAALWLFNRKAY